MKLSWQVLFSLTFKVEAGMFLMHNSLVCTDNHWRVLQFGPCTGRRQDPLCQHMGRFTPVPDIAPVIL